VPVGDAGGPIVRTLLVLTIALAAVAPAVVATPIQTYVWMPASGEPDPEFGPDVPPASAPVATVVAIEDEVWHGTEGFRTHTMTVPAVPWSRVIMTYRQNPIGDPWDRLFQVTIAGVEVLRGTTPRSDFTIQKDMTRYATLLPPGARVDVAAATGEYDEAPYVGYQHVWVTLDFYAEDASTPLVEPRWPFETSVYTSRGMCANTLIDVPVTFPAAPWSKGKLEFFATNHGSEEAQFSSRHFDVLVDGQLLTTVYTFPYRYAFIGFYGGDTTEHPVMWWSVHHALDIAGVHTGPGEIPPYRLDLNADQLAKLHGAKTVEVRAGNVYNCIWITSLNFLLDG
jgi:hypothetical protein